VTSRTGLYPNYPYNDLNPDKFISTTDTNFVSATCSINNYNPNSSYRRDTFTFHSPDTQFRNPFLSMKEVKLYGQISGTVEGAFKYPDKHPKHKLVTDLAFYVGLIAGMGNALLATNGQRSVNHLGPRQMNMGLAVLGATNGLAPFDGGALGLTAVSANTALQTAATIAHQAGENVISNLAGVSTEVYYAAILGSGLPVGIAPGTLGYGEDIVQQDGKYANIPTPLRLFSQIPTFLYYFSEGTDAVIRLIKSVIPYKQHALQYQSHCLFNTWANPQFGNRRRLITDSIYLDNQIQDYSSNYRINNLYRGRSVALTTASDFNDAIGDNSRQTVGDRGLWTSPETPFNTSASSHYGALKNRIRNQYGQIGSVQQIVTGCINYVTITSPQNTFTSKTIFGGDTYVCRYSEKNTMFYFYDWLYDQPDGFEYNYHLKKMVPNPAFWMDTEEVDVPEFLSSVVSNLIPFTPSAFQTPSHQRVFDRNGCTNLFQVKEAYIYLFNSGIRDFYVESEINTDFRDWNDAPSDRHYDPYRYTDLKELFHPSIIKSGNLFKYDFSLSLNRLFSNNFSWAFTQPINYDPKIYASCYTYQPNRLIYSLPQQLELLRDNWKVYLSNNYKDFKTKVVCIKPINKTGAIMFFDTDSPVQFTGVDTMQTDLGVKVTIGDGGLFNQPLQSIMNSDRPYEYGACQNRDSVVATPMGLFWISLSTGKIYTLQGGIKEISMVDQKWWLAQYLPLKITQQFPNFELKDNSVVGVGCQTIYDNENGIVYFIKRDYTLKKVSGAVVTYVSKNNFLVNGVLPIKLGDPTYFNDASFTISYDAKNNEWLGYHDWHPEGVIPGKNTFMSYITNAAGNGTIWTHNTACQLYCNYYGKDYPFEIEFETNTVQDVNTLRSVQCQVEVYKFADNCYDRYLMLDEFFDEAIIYNLDQISGLLRLVETPRNSPFAMLNYPKITPNFIEILYSKVENKYRFNQFWDVTDDRGQKTNARRMIFNTSDNGYTRSINDLNINYQKPPFQRKKFRGYEVTVFLRKRVCGPNKFLVILQNTKQLHSPR